MNFLLTGCQFKATSFSNIDWPVEVVTTVNDSSFVQVNNNINSNGNPDKVEVKEPINSGSVNVGLQTNVNSTANKALVAQKFIDLKVLFAPQAPFANWDELHNEACEEASMIMADVYFNDKPLSAHIMEQGILDLVKWETENGYSVDITAAEVVDILKKYFNLQGEIIDKVNPEKIKSLLDERKLIIVPAAGRLLGNPNYKSPGPLYHMLVIRGYDESRGEFITNDPGTRKGDGYRYKYQKFIKAIHDWPKLGLTKDFVSEEEMNNGRVVIVAVSGE